MAVMAMKKTELEEHRDSYDALLSSALAAERNGEHRRAVQAALQAWEYVDGMMQYERRYGGREFDSIKAIDLVLKYAPLLLDYQSLDRLADLLKASRRIEKNTSESLADLLQTARSKLWDVHRFYGHLEMNPDARQDELRQVLGGDQDSWRAISEAWEKMGMVSRLPSGGSYTLRLVTRLGEIVPAICPSCGVRTEGPKGMLLEPLSCPECGASVTFVLLSDTRSDTEG
jgi:hypothetical protein